MPPRHKLPLLKQICRNDLVSLAGDYNWGNLIGVPGFQLWYKVQDSQESFKGEGNMFVVQNSDEFMGAGEQMPQQLVATTNGLNQGDNAFFVLKKRYNRKHATKMQMQYVNLTAGEVREQCVGAISQAAALSSTRSLRQLGVHALAQQRASS